MANINKVTGLDPSLASLLIASSQKINGLRAGEALATGDLVYIKNDGKVWKATGAANADPAKVVGMVMVPSDANEPCTPVHDCVVRYANALTPGAQLWLGTGGLFADAATTGGLAPIGFVIDAQRVFIHPAYY
jgi:hypothetical protein